MVQIALDRLKNVNIRENLHTLLVLCAKNIEYFFIGVIVFKCFLFNTVVGSKTTLMFPIGTAGSALVLLSLVFWLERKPRAVALLIIDILMSVIMLSDIVYFRYYDNLITFPVLKQIGQVDSSLASSILNLLSVFDVIFFLDIPVFFSVVVIVFKDSQRVGKKFISRICRSIVVLMLGLSMVFSGLFVISKTMGEAAFMSVFDNGYFLRNVGVLSFHAFDTYFNLTRVVDDKEQNPGSEEDQIKSLFTSRKKEDGSKLNGVARGKNLIVIQVEALQNFVLGLKINGKEVTPNLNKLSREHIYFSNYYSQIAQGNTSDAEFVTNNSFYPLSQGAAYFRCVNNSFTSLARLFKEQGYTTAAMHAYKGSYWNRAIIYPRMGFDRYFSQKDFVQDEKLGWGLSDRSFFRQAVEKMKEMKQPFYSFLVTLSSHYPFNGFKKIDEFNLNLGSSNTYGNYINAMHYVDQCIGEFIEQLRDAGFLQNSVIAIYGDHEGLKKKDENEIDPAVNPVFKNHLGWINMKNVPLIIMVPGLKQPMRIDNVGGQVDFLPTIANLFNLKPVYYMGRDLINSKQNYVTFRDGTVTDGKTVYIKETDECIDVVTGEPVEKEMFQKYIDKSAEDLALSDKVLENNLINVFLTGRGNLE